MLLVFRLMLYLALFRCISRSLLFFPLLYNASLPLFGSDWRGPICSGWPPVPQLLGFSLFLAIFGALGAPRAAAIGRMSAI